MSDRRNVEQVEYWNGPAGDAWSKPDTPFDRMLEPYLHHLVQAADLEGTESVLDIGCGTGATTRAAAGKAHGHVVGIDLSAQMVAAGRAAAAAEGLDNVELTQGDAQTMQFTPEFDIAMSRFGTMFFDDPVAAFANIRVALRPEGRLTFLCWEPIEANEWAFVPATAVADVVGATIDIPTDVPGPYALSDRERVEAILAAAGYTSITLDGIREPIWIGDSVERATEHVMATGTISRLIGDAGEGTRRAAAEAVSIALAPFATPEGVCAGSAAWLVRAAS